MKEEQKQAEVNFAKMALRLRLLSAEQIKEARSIKSRLQQKGRTARLQTILTKKGYLSAAQVELITRKLRAGAKLQNVTAIAPERGSAKQGTTNTNRKTDRKLTANRTRSGLAHERARQRGSQRTRSDAAAQRSSGPKLDELPRIEGYKLLKVIGQGSMGLVVAARQLSMDRLVAIKILAPELSSNANYVQRFLREARAAARLHHENIVGGIDAGQIGDFYYYIMEYVDGKTLGALLLEQGTLPEEQAIRIVLQVSRALEHAHKHAMVHRDIKPDNIIITDEGMVKLCDLGLARGESGQGTSVTLGPTCMGTPNYISPEQAQGFTDVDIRSDIYSLGITFFKMVTGRLPFNNPNPAIVCNLHMCQPIPDPCELAPTLSRATGNVILKMTAKQPAERFASPAKLIKALLKLQKHGKGKKSPGAPPLLTSPTATHSPSPTSRKTTSLKGTSARTRLRRGRRNVLRSSSPLPLSWYLGLAFLLMLLLGGVTAILIIEQSHNQVPDPSNVAAKAPTTPPAPVDRVKQLKNAQAVSIFNSISEFERAHPYAYQELLKRYQALMQEYPQTTGAWMARKQIEDLQTRAEKQAQTSWQSIAQRISNLEQKGQLQKVYTLYRRFPEELAFTKIGRELRQKQQALAKSLQANFQQGMQKLEQLIGAGKYREAFIQGPQLYQRILPEQVTVLKKKLKTWRRQAFEQNVPLLGILLHGHIMAQHASTLKIHYDFSNPHEMQDWMPQPFVKALMHNMGMHVKMFRVADGRLYLKPGTTLLWQPPIQGDLEARLTIGTSAQLYNVGTALFSDRTGQEGFSVVYLNFRPAVMVTMINKELAVHGGHHVVLGIIPILPPRFDLCGWMSPADNFGQMASSLLILRLQGNKLDININGRSMQAQVAHPVKYFALITESSTYFDDITIKTTLQREWVLRKLGE